VLGDQSHGRLAVGLIPGQIAPRDQPAAHRGEVTWRDIFEAPYGRKAAFGSKLVLRVDWIVRTAFQRKSVDGPNPRDTGHCLHVSEDRLLHSNDTLRIIDLC